MTSKKLKIGVVCYPSVGGSGIVATNLGLELAKLGHEIHFISYEQPFRLIKRHPNVHFHQVEINEYSVFKYPDYTLPLAVAIEETQRKYLLDIVHVHYAVPHATAALLAKRIMLQNKIALPKVITTLHGTDITLLAKDPALLAIIKYSVEKSDGVTAVSEDLKTDTQKVLTTDKPIEVIHNFYTPQPIATKRQGLRRRLGVRAKDFLAIHLSNLRPVKRIPDLLNIAAKIQKPNFKMLILAGGDFGPYQPLAKKLRLGKKLIIQKNVRDIQNYIHAADAGVYTSETESFGMGILETMSYGKPVLATKAGGVPEVVTDGQTGFLLPVGNITGFAKKLQMLINDRQLLETMGQTAKDTACAKFCSKIIVPKYLEYYKKIL